MGQIAEGFASEELKSATTLEVGTATAGSTTLDDDDKDTQSPPGRRERHIIDNLLPVKQRLTRQLAAQKGATRNPITAPLSACGSMSTNGGNDSTAVGTTIA
jgi:hypothetical protein